MSGGGGGGRGGWRGDQARSSAKMVKNGQKRGFWGGYFDPPKMGGGPKIQNRLPKMLIKFSLTSATSQVFFPYRSLSGTDLWSTLLSRKIGGDQAGDAFLRTNLTR